MMFALIGNQNCGKTTLYNQLTGSRQHVGNFPGVTVEQKKRKLKNKDDCYIVDLPGTYSINAYSKEENVTRDFLLNEKVDGIINIVDANNLDRNLYLTLQLLEMNIPTVVALNMMDEIEKKGIYININKIEKYLNVPVIPISALKNKGIDELVENMFQVINSKKYALICTSCKSNNCVNNKIRKLSDEEIAKDKFNYIEEICKNVIENKEEYNRSIKIDKIVTNKYLSIPIFLIIMLVIFFLTFNIIGPFLSDMLQRGIDVVVNIISDLLIRYNANNVVYDLIVNGIFKGVGSVLGFLPIITTLFFFLAILEDTGYMARVAFIMDALLRKIGLSGKSIVPMLIGFGCSVPAIMSTRTMFSKKDRELTILLIPFISCSAKIPIYAIFSATFFKNYSAIAMLVIYILGIILGICIILLLSKTRYKKSSVPFIIELPSYRIPSIKNILLLMLDKSKEFIDKAFTVILFTSIAIWFLQSFDINFKLITNSENSILALIGKAIVPAFKPIGFLDWRICTSLLTGLSAKENVISTLSILTNTSIDGLPIILKEIFTTSSSVSFLIFTLLYTPCIASIATIRKELNSWGKTIKIVLMQCAIAWTFSFLIFNMIEKINII